MLRLGASSSFGKKDHELVIKFNICPRAANNLYFIA